MPAATPKCRGYAGLHAWGKCTRVQLENSNWRASYADHTYEFKGDYDTQGAAAPPCTIAGVGAELC